MIMRNATAPRTPAISSVVLLVVESAGLVTGAVVRSEYIILDVLL